MKATCSKKGCTSKKFVTVAHVVEEWVVNEYGDFEEKLETLETTHGPDPQNSWTCQECGAAALVEN